MSRSCRRGALVILGFAALSRPGFAQSERGQGNDDKSCVKAAKILEKGHPDKKELWAYGTISGCAGAAGLLGASWVDPPSDPEALQALAAATYEVADSRIVTALLTAVQQTQLSFVTRVTVLKLLISQYNKEKGLGFDSRDSSAWIGRYDHAYQVSGEQPVTPADRQRMRDAFIALAASDPQPRIRAAAKAIMREIHYF